MKGMTALKDECEEKADKQSARMRSDMDQIMSSRDFLESKLKGNIRRSNCPQVVIASTSQTLDTMA